MEGVRMTAATTWTIPVTVTARNEARAIRGCLQSLRAAMRFAEQRLPVRLDLLVVLDDCVDATERIVRELGVPYLTSSGGKVEAQRRGVREGPFLIFCDADVRVTEETCFALCEAMLAEPSLLAAFPPKEPLPPRRRTPLSWALHLYNLRRGFSSQRTWFSGKLFALRRWELPDPDEVRRRALALPPSRFYDFEAGMRVDDIYLSRWVLREAGPTGLRETASGKLLFRAPETLRGMFRHYRRMRMELERLDLLFPETADVHRRYGTRTADVLAERPVKERLAFVLFQAALVFCRAGYRVERAWFEHLARSRCEPWPAIAETKEP
jgi:glycosyltransferase involved in cell wall biosynthesis